ncbi:uncharacterized protein LOC135152207 [Daucus carota subsp. sativus]|uniref:uncharacterized protein LOC135152207 n=1 Tax=Daucus carota subsp. sativus TaxID=79200 RepID=UPI0030837FD0
MPDWMVINCFYNGLGPQSRPMLDASSDGALWAMSYDEAYELIEMMAANEYQNPTQRLPQGKVAGILDVDATSVIAAQLKALTMKVDSLANLGNQQPPSVCELCAGTHTTDQCAISSESAQFIGQIANTLINRPQGILRSDTEANPGKKEVKEQVQAVTLRSRKVTKDKDSATEHNKEESEQRVETPVLSSKSDSEKTVVDADKKEIKEEASKESAEKSSRKSNNGDKQVYPPPPFSKRLQKQKLDKQFTKFLEKLKLEKLETVALTEECSAVLQQKLPPKLKDPGSFTIPCTTGQLSFDKCLCDLGASINLMPLSVFKKLEFVEDKKIPIILGRPFLATGQTLLDVQKGELTKRVQDQSVTFKVFNSIKFPTDEEECFKVEPLEFVENSETGQKLRPGTLERVLTWDSDSEDEGVAELKNFQEHRNPSIEEAPELELKLPPDLLSDVQFRRLSRRIDDMHDIHRRFAKDLTQVSWKENEEEIHSFK